MTAKPWGPCFISYKRSRAEEVQRLVNALHERGIPTWQDIKDLRSEPTEDQIRDALDADKQQTSAAVLFVTPEVEESPMIRKLEAQEIFKRKKTDRLNFLISVVLFQVDYTDADKILDSPAAPEALTRLIPLSQVRCPVMAGRVLMAGRRPHESRSRSFGGAVDA